MSSADYLNLVIRKTTSYNPDGSYVPSGQVFTVGEKGKQDWASNLGLNQLLVSTVSASSTITSYTTNTTNLSVSSIGYVSSLQSNTIAATSTIDCSTFTSPYITTSTVSSNSVYGTIGQFSSTLTTYSAVTSTLNVSGNTSILGNVSILGNMNINGTTTVSSLVVQTSVSTGTISVLSDATIGSTLFTSTIACDNISINIANISTSLYVGSTIQAPYGQISTVVTSILNTTTANVTSSLTVLSTVIAPYAQFTTINGSTFNTSNAAITSSLTVGSTLTTSYMTYSTMVGSTLTTAFAYVLSSLTVGSSISAPFAQLSSIINSTLTTNTISATSNILVGSTLTSPFIQVSTLIGSAITTTTAYVLSSVTIGSTFTVPFITLSTLLGSTLTTTVGMIASTLAVGSTLTSPFIQVSTLLGSTINATTLNVLNLFTVSILQTSSLIGSTMTSVNAIVYSTLTIGSTIITPYVSTTSFFTSTITTNTLFVTSTATVSSLSTATITATRIAVSTIIDLQGAPFSAVFGKSGMVCSNLPLTFGSMSVMIDRPTKKISLSYTTAINVLYKTEYYVYNGSSWIQGFDVPPSATPISLASLKFPVAAYNLSTVGAWCSLSITDMTNFTGTWTINAECVRAGANGDDLYSSEFVQSINAVALTTVPDPPTSVLPSLYPAGNPYGVAYSFIPPAVTGGYISGYEAFATSDSGVTYYTKIGFSSPIVVTGLTPGTNYALTLKAKNAKGQSVAASGGTIVYKTLPDAPTSIVGALYPSGAATGINVTFTYPSNTGGGVDLYYASAMDTASTQTTILNSNPTSPIYLSAGLVPGTTYRLGAYSQNAGGTSAASTSIATLLYQIPPPTAPAITSLALTPAGNPTGIAVGFTAPPNTGGGIVDYITNLYSGALGTGTSASTIGTISPITVNTSLTAGNIYSFRVTGRNTGGTGVLSAYSSIVYKTLPTAPSLIGLSLYPAGNPIGVQVLLTPPANVGGGVDTYTASAYYGPTLIAASISTTTTIIVSSLISGTSYTISGVATNAGGTSVISNTSTIQYKTKPDPPTSVAGALYPIGAATGINVSFAYPINNGGVVDQYFASAMDIASTAATVTAQLSTSPIYLSAGLVAGTTYNFAVYSQNSGGTSLASTSATNLLFQTVPGAPTGITTLLTPIGNPTGVTVGFTAPGNTGGGVNTYTAFAYSSVVAVASTIGVSSPIVVQTLTPGTPYNFVVRATNTAGTGVGSASSLITYKTLPSVPTNVVGALYPVGAAAGINVNFAYPTDLGGGVDTYYALAFDAANTASTVLVSNTTSPIYIPSTAGLVAGTTYKLAVYAKNAGGSTASTLSGSNLLFQIPATAPLSLTTVLTPTGNPYGITASFLAPTNTGGGVSYYTVSMYNGTTFIDTKQGSALSYLFSTPNTSITPGTSYNFYANAVNTGGSGASSITSAIVYKTLPDPPTNVVGALYPVGAGTGINITFSYPANLGGGVDLYYAMAIDAVASASTVLSTSATSPIFINTAMGLVPGTTYKFAVFSKNTGGSSTSTISGSNLFYQTLPTAPTSVTAALDPANNPTGVNVSFTAPANTFGGISNYQAIAYTGTMAIASSIGASSPIKVSTLTAGTSYNYVVAAINNAGIGVSSAYTTLVYYTQPGTATGVSMALQPSATPTGVNVAFTPTGTTGGGALTYTARAYTGTTVIGTGSNTVSPVYVTGLTAGTSYNFTVTANNAAVTGLSTNGIAYTYYTNPSVPLSITTLVGFSIGSQQAKISWAAPTTNGGSTISSYTITSNPAVYTTTVASSIVTVTTGAVLTNGTPYTFTVLATNSAGLSSSAVSGSTTPYDLAGQPTSLAGTVSNGQIALSWTAPNGNGATINNYKVVQTGYASNTYYVGSGTVSYNVTGLVNGQSYTFSVAATNDNTNYGTASGSITKIIGTVPSVPTSISVAQNGVAGQLVLTWSAPVTNGGIAITNYYVSSGGGYTATNSTSSPQTWTFTGLANNTGYTLYVYAFNSLGNGTTGSASGTTLAPPTIALSSTARGVNQITISWAVSSNGGNAISSYTATITGRAAITNISSSATSYTFTDLATGTSYTPNVYAINSVGAGNTITGSATSTYALPTTPSIIGGTPSTTQAPAGGSIIFSWYSSNGDGLAVTYYLSNGANTQNGYATVSGLFNGGPQTVSVYANTAAGNSASSSLTLTIPPGKPTIYNLGFNNSSYWFSSYDGEYRGYGYDVYWLENNGGSGITGRSVTYNGSSVGTPNQNGYGGYNGYWSIGRTGYEDPPTYYVNGYFTVTISNAYGSHSVQIYGYNPIPATIS
jgi:titin